METSSNETYENASVYDPMRVIPYPGRVAIVVAYSVLFFVGSTANLAIFTVTLVKKSLHTSTNIMVANLTIGDLLMNIPLVLTPLQALLGQWMWGELLCRIFNSVSVMSVFISSLTLAMMAFHRYMTVLHIRAKPAKCRLLNSCVVRCAIIWLLAICITIPTMINSAIYNHEETAICTDVSYYLYRGAYTVGLMVVQFVIPSLVMFYCHLRIHLQLKKRFHIVSAFAKTVRTTQKLESIARRRQVHRVLAAMVVAYVTSWLPLNAFNMAVEYSHNLSHWAYAMPVFFAAHFVAMASTVCNPLMYVVANPDFRRRLRNDAPNTEL